MSPRSYSIINRLASSVSTAAVLRIITRAEMSERRFYRAMHYSAKRGPAIACPFVCPSVRL